MVAALPIVVMVVLLPVMIMTTAIVVMVMMMAMTILIMVLTVAAAIIVIMMMMFVIMVMASASTILTVFVVVMMVMGTALAVDVHHDAGVLERMECPVLQLVVIYIQHCGHEAEVHGLAGPYLPVVQDALCHIREVHGERLLPVGDGHLDVSHEGA